MSAHYDSFGRSGKLHHNAALWLNGLILLTFLAASTAPTPLYSVYREAWNFLR